MIFDIETAKGHPVKKALSAAAAIAIAAFATNPASAALTTALPEGQTLWVMNTENGNFNELDPIAGTVTPVFATSVITSDSWVVGADYDPTTNAVYWIKDFNRQTQAIVRFDLDTETETAFVTAASTHVIRGIDVTDGVVRISGRAASDGHTDVAVVNLDEDALTGTLSDVLNVGTMDQSALAIDPTDGQMYVLTYGCDLYSITDGVDTFIANFVDTAGATSDCIALDFDDSGRAWMTHNSTGSTLSFVPADIAGSAELSEWDSFDNTTEYGESIFVKGASEAVEDNSSLASTGFDAGALYAGAAGLLTLGAITIAARRRSS